MARLRNAAQQPTVRVSSRKALKEKTNTANAPLYVDDGNTEGLVKNAKTRKGRSQKTVRQDSDELMMAGGLGRSTSDAPMATDELEKGEHAPPPTSKPNRRLPRTAKKVTQSQAQNQVLEGLRQRMQATARGQRAKQTTTAVTSNTLNKLSDPSLAEAAVRTLDREVIEPSELSLSSSPSPPGKLAVAQGPRSSLAQPGSVLRLQATPAMESSILALKNFKRRPRQPSMLQMVQQRTASARPSIAHTVVENTAVEDQSVFDLGLDTDEEDDFAPEAEGTPLHPANHIPLSSASTKRPTSASFRTATSKPNVPTKKRKSDSLEEFSHSLTADHVKHAKMTDPAHDGNVARSPPVDQPAAAQSGLLHTRTPQAAITSEVQVISSSPTSTPLTEPPSLGTNTGPEAADFVIPSTERDGHNGQPNHENDLYVSDDSDDDGNGSHGTMADPLSSSPAVKALPMIEDPLAYPLTQDSPLVAKQKPRKRTKPISTFTLQSMLPKRRQPLRPRRRKSEYDIESESDDDSFLDASNLEDDEDELGGRLRRQTKTVPARTPKVTGAKRGRPSKAVSVATRKPSAAPVRKSSAAAFKKAPRTYGRAVASASDKENDIYESEEEPDESTLQDVSISMEAAAQSKELEDAKRKFAEVDDWDMDFESMSAEQHRSSSQDWR